MDEMLEDIISRQNDTLLIDKVEALVELLGLQSKCCNNDYQIGLYNGLVLGLSVLTGEQPKFYDFEGGKENVKE